MNEGDRSNRTPDWWLDHVWGMQTQPGVLRLPQWAKRDEVVQSMINKDEVDEIMYHGDRKQSKNVSLTPEFVEDENVESLGGSKRHNQRNKQGKEEESAVGLASKQTLPGDTPKLNKAHANTPAIQPAESTADRPENQSHPKAKASSPRSRRAPRRVDSALGLDETKGVLRAQASGIKKRPRAVKGATKAATQ